MAKLYRKKYGDQLSPTDRLNIRMLGAKLFKVCRNDGCCNIIWRGGYVHGNGDYCDGQCAYESVGKTNKRVWDKRRLLLASN